MRIQTADQVRGLNAQDKDSLIADITRELVRQHEENDKLKSVAEKANQGLTIWKLVTTAVGAVIAFAVGVLWFGGQYSAWEAIKTAHSVDQGNGQFTYGHQSFLPPEIAAMKLALGMPDFDEFALKSEAARHSDLVGLIRFGQNVSLQGPSQLFLFDNAAQNRPETNVLMSGAQPWIIQPLQ